MQEAVGEQVSGEGNPGWNSRRLSRLHVKQSTSLAGKKGAGSLVIYSMEVHLNSLGWNWKLLLNTDCVHFFSRPSLWPIYLWNHVWHISREERFKLERWSLYGFQGYTQASLEVQTVKNLPAMGETWVWSLGWGTFPGGGHGNPLQYSCLENLHGQRSLVGDSPWGHKELGTAEQLSTAHDHTHICVYGHCTA